MSPAAGYYRRVKEEIAMGKREKLTKVQLRVALEIVKGKSNEEIAQALNAHIKTVKFHLTPIFQKAQVTTRAKFIAHYYMGYLPEPMQAQMPRVHRAKKEVLEPKPYPDILPALVLGSQKAFK